ncbi:hypothetical protein GCM10011608_09820 [Micromonospora sonchi]|uniref:Phage head morphogenesis domain-containing protein n=1 Tax=Micromonospora sonchi TaxID=1763543 RepID=A0A917WT56_9ACTN|nr:hypothetical protein [Micromonospora sonchi]GGM27077.1 hypothetical protein GCM10011608_09820 [Micromonospora sonchi]
MAVTSRTLQLLRAMRTAVGGYADDAVRDLAEQWTHAWRRIAPTWREAVDVLVAWAAQHGRWPTPVEIGRIEQVPAALDATTAELDALTAATIATVTAAAGLAIAATADGEPRIIASQVPAAYRNDLQRRAAQRILPSALDVIRIRVGQAITAQSRPLGADAAAAIRRELVRGVKVGANPIETARRAVAAVQGAFEGGSQRAAVIARTETLDAYRVASRYAHEANADVLGGWIWLATVNGKGAARTCSSCWALHGTVWPLGSAGPLDHQQGRCGRAPHVRPWRELGINIDEPSDAIPDRQAAWDALTPAQQRQVMGARRLALLRSGRIGWDDIPQLRTNTAWRDSYTPRPVSDLERIADQRR